MMAHPPKSSFTIPTLTTRHISSVGGPTEPQQLLSPPPPARSFGNEVLLLEAHQKDTQEEDAFKNSSAASPDASRPQLAINWDAVARWTPKAASRRCATSQSPPKVPRTRASPSFSQELSAAPRQEEQLASKTTTGEPGEPQMISPSHYLVRRQECMAFGNALKELSLGPPLLNNIKQTPFTIADAFISYAQSQEANSARIMATLGRCSVPEGNSPLSLVRDSFFRSVLPGYEPNYSVFSSEVNHERDSSKLVDRIQKEAEIITEKTKRSNIRGFLPH